MESIATLAAAVLMTIAGFAAMEDVAATPPPTTIAPIRVLNVVGTSETPARVAMPHVDSPRG